MHAIHANILRNENTYSQTGKTVSVTAVSLRQTAQIYRAVYP